MNIIEDISPLAAFKREPARIIARIRESGRPHVLTENGRSSVVVMDAAVWQEMRDELEHVDTVANIHKGLAHAAAGEGIEVNRFFEELASAK